MRDLMDLTDGRELVMVSNRLPVDRVVAEDGSTTWRTSPGGLVTAVEPIVEQLGCVWVGWAGSAGEALDPFEIGSMQLVPVELSDDDVELYYEGFSNGTLWPLYHDVIAQPQFHREWWERYRIVNQRFADRVAAVAPVNATVWIHDYQLQLVPAMLRELRPDVTIAFFLHIPFPPGRLFSQLPWRRRIVRGLLGADVIGFQRVADAADFRATVERLTDAPALGNTIVLTGESPELSRGILAQEFPISIDADAFMALAEQPDIRRRAAQIREELGDPQTLILGVDRLDYTKGITHRIKAYGEMLADGEIDATNTVFVQVATPSRERVEAYRELRGEIEATVGRLNGEHGTIRQSPLVYLHRGYSRTEMVALYLAADVMLVTPLRDGMNLVAKEYVACRSDEQGVLVLSEFAGAADEFPAAVLVNPHDIEGLKSAILRAVHMPQEEQRRRMRSLRQALGANDVAHWASTYLGAVQTAARARHVGANGERAEPFIGATSFVPSSVEDRVRRLAAASNLLVATDFDGTIAPIVTRPQDARILPRAHQALDALAATAGTNVAVLTGRSLAGLAQTGLRAENWIVSGSHGAELVDAGAGGTASTPAATDSALIGGPPTSAEIEQLDRVEHKLRRVFSDEPGVHLERKPLGISFHTRSVQDREHAEELLAAAVELGTRSGMSVRAGKEVREFSVRLSHKGEALRLIRNRLPPGPVLFLGDDLTDEDVFASLEADDLGIKIGQGDTLASERVPDPETAAAVLALLAELRAGVIIGTE